MALTRRGMTSALPVAGRLAVAVIAVLGLAAGAAAQENRGWLGIRLECQGCRVEESEQGAVWWFTREPTIEWVREDGPAAQAGMQAGDVIVAIDGIPLVSDEGGRRFGAMRAGQAVRFTIQRGGRELTVGLTPGSYVEAFGVEEIRVGYVITSGWDSLSLQLKQLQQGHQRLEVALREAERALSRSQAEAERTGSAQQRQTAVRLRTQIDSIQRALTESQRQIRVRVDSIAAMTLYIVPDVGHPLEPPTPQPPRARALTVYRDAVAGARFEELGGDLAEYFPGVTHGLLIVRVVEETPAYRAGLREGDVVVAVNGHPVSTVAELRALWPTGRDVELTFVRRGKKHTCEIPWR